MKRLHIGLVSTFPPSIRPLSQYAWHLADALIRHPDVERLTVLADRHPGEPDDDHGDPLRVVRCWSFGAFDQPVSIPRAARRSAVDALWFNLHLTSSGNSRASRFAGLLGPAAARATGLVTIVTLHNMLGLTDLQWTGLRASRLDLAAADLATRLIGRAHTVCVLAPEYAELLRSRYGMRNVRVVPHGTLGEPVAAVSLPATNSLLAFGHFGSYKRLDDLLRVVAELADRGLDVRLDIAGTDSRHRSGYLAGLARQYRHAPYVTFSGYVPESDVPAVFRRAAVSVLPYATTTGVSGVAIQSAMYGVPMVASDVPGFRSLERQGFRLNFFEWSNRESLKTGIVDLLASPQRRSADAAHNLACVRRQRMDDVVAEYVEVIEAALDRSNRSSSRRPLPFHV